MNWRIVLIAGLLVVSACEKKSDVPVAGSVTEAATGAATASEAVEVPAAPASAKAETCDTPECEKACAGVRAEFAKDCPWAYSAGCFDGTAPADFPCESFIKRGEEVEGVEAAGAGASQPDSVPAAPVTKGKRRPRKLDTGGSPKSKAAPKVFGDDDDPDFKPTPIGD